MFYVLIYLYNYQNITNKRFCPAHFKCSNISILWTFIKLILTCSWRTNSAVSGQTRSRCCKARTTAWVVTASSPFVTKRTSIRERQTASHLSTFARTTFINTALESSLCRSSILNWDKYRKSDVRKTTLFSVDNDEMSPSTNCNASTAMSRRGPKNLVSILLIRASGLRESSCESWWRRVGTWTTSQKILQWWAYSFTSLFILDVAT